ncbi:MAG: transcription elongation factor GreB [Gammaproteobacteria bacterium]|nr:transcription elongation factor GreB [Gammaproteobacteria bacterium]MBQ0838566.1 transcription elongation factor GreB [Gammaproteobacteria bacterium]
MGRYRPPREPSSPYITSEGAKTLREELRQLWKIERPQVTAVVHEAAKNGDRSENGDYIYGKRRLREIDSRVRYLTNRLEDITVVDRTPGNIKKVFFGAWVSLEDDQGKSVCYRIVGADELDASKGYISVDSPLAKALIGKNLDDEITFTLHGESHDYLIIEIRYFNAAFADESNH